jgi:hypothetical protein
MGRHCEEQRDDAIQHPPVVKAWIASLALAMTVVRALHTCIRKLPVVPICRIPTGVALSGKSERSFVRPALARGALRDRHER